MSPQGPGKSQIGKAYALTLKSLRNKPVLFLPFLIFAIVEVLALIILYLSPRQPLLSVFGPPIRTFWGEAFLHYPTNFLLLPKLAYISRMLLSVIIGSLLTGVAVAIASDVYNKKHIKLSASFKLGIKKYIYLFAVVFVLTTLLYFSGKIIKAGLIRYFLAGHSQLLFIKPQAWLGPILIFINLVLVLLLQGAFIFTIPLLIIEKERLIRSIAKSFVLFIKLFVPAILLIGLPLLLYVPVMVLQFNSVSLIDKLFPEFILLVSLLGIIISSLIMDPLVTICATFLYLAQKELA